MKRWCRGEGGKEEYNGVGERGKATRKPKVLR